MSALCEDFGFIKDVQQLSDGCEDCLASGDSWVHLRMCLICGRVGCCDASPNKHAAIHFQETGHPVIKSLEPDEGWVFCYQHDLFADELALSVPEES
jgi:uncharacterized UBP type Zn finger protein